MPANARNYFRSRQLLAPVLMAVAIVAATASTAFAVDCVVTVQRVREENNGKLMAFFNSTWHLVAGDTHPARADRLSMVMAAYLANKTVMLRYGATYSCTATEYGEVPSVVELQ